MEVNNKRAVIDLNKDLRATVNLKRKRASRYAAHLSSFNASSKGRDGPNLGRCKKRIKTDVEKCCSDEFKWCSRKAVLQNYGNFSKSSIPVRVMHFWKGQWNDFPANTLDSLKEAFQAGKSVCEVLLDGSSCLVDFHRMVQIDLKTGIQRSVAWIDKNDKCFFPSVVESNGCFNSVDSNKEECACLGCEKAQQIEVKVEIGISAVESSKSENSSEVSVTHHAEQNKFLQVLHTDSSELEQDSCDAQKPSRVFSSGQWDKTCIVNGLWNVTPVEALPRDSRSGLCTDSSRTLGFGILGDRLIKVDEGNHEFMAVRNRFLAGLCTLVTFSRIVGIYRISPSGSSSGQARLQAYQNHVEIIKKNRGNANVKYAWYGTSRDGVTGVVLHGFGQTRTPKSGAAYGIGVYLSPVGSSHVSAAYSDVDENGEQHMVLCRVIMGNMEQVKPGSQQFHPSNEHFDSGVDDIKNPKHYIVWSTHMNTHIHPEYVVSFKVSTEVHDYWDGLRANNAINGANRSFPGGHLQQGSTSEMARNQQSPALEAQKKTQGPADVPVKLPTSAYMEFPVLFSVIGKHLPPSSIHSLERHYADFKTRRITRDDLIKRVRMVAGDKLLIDAIKSIKNQKNGMQGFDRMDHVTCSALHSEEVHSKNEFTSFGNKTSVMGQSKLQGQNPNRPKSTINNAQQFSCKDEDVSPNGQAHN